MQAVVLTADLPADTRARSGILAQYRDLAARISAEAPVTITLTGFPLIADAVSRTLDRDAAVLNTLGVVAGLVVAWIALRSLVQALAISLVAHTTRLWTFAALHPLGYEINAVSITLLTLIVVLAFSKAIHLAMAARRTYHNGKPDPLWRALRHVWPAAALAALTTSGAFATLHLGPSEMVSDLAFFGSFAILVSTPLTLGLFCLITVTAGRVTDPGRILRSLPTDAARARLFVPLERLVTRHAGALSLSPVLVVCVSSLGYMALEPDARLFDGLHESESEMRTLRRIEAAFGTATNIVFEHPIAPPDAIARGTRALSELSPWGSATGLSQPELDTLPQALRDRLVSRDGMHTLISLPYRYDGSDRARADIAALEARIAETPALARLGPAIGVVHVWSFFTGEILAAFSLSFALAAAAAGLGIGLWLRSLPLGLLSVIPNVLPITMVGTIMWLFDLSFTYASGVALTIAFGIAIDDTVHMINRIRAEAGCELTEDAVRRALRGIGPTLILTSAVLIGGLSSTLFSSLPALVAFGALSISVFVLALLADLVLLPALFIWFAWRRGGPARKAP